MHTSYVRCVPELTRITVNLHPKAANALINVAQLNEESKTDAVNRALQLYDLWCRTVADGEEFYIKGANGKMRSIALL